MTHKYTIKILHKKPRDYPNKQLFYISVFHRISQLQYIRTLQMMQDKHKRTCVHSNRLNELYKRACTVILVVNYFNLSFYSF